MSLFDNIFGSSEVQYPTTTTQAASAGHGTGRACGDGPYQAPDSDSLFNKLFAPAPLPYPLPPCGYLAGGDAGGSGGTLGGSRGSAGGPGTADTATAALAAACSVLASSAPSGGMSSTPPAATPPAATPPAATPPAATPPADTSTAPAAACPAPSPVTVVINVPSAPATVAPSSAPTSAPAATTPSAPANAVPSVPATTVPPTPAVASAPSVVSSTLRPPIIPVGAPSGGSGDDVPPDPESLLPQQPVILTAVSSNPRFRAHHSPAQESLIEEMIDETLTAHMVTKNSQAIALVVPDGCDSVEFCYGPIELGEHGKDGDLDLVVTVGEAQILGDVGNIDGTGLGRLLPGSALMVTVPWRAASFVNLSANHLQVTLYAKFYSAIEPLSSAS
jgi:hypothetical protein